MDARPWCGAFRVSPLKAGKEEDLEMFKGAAAREKQATQRTERKIAGEKRVRINEQNEFLLQVILNPRKVHVQVDWESRQESLATFVVI